MEKTSIGIIGCGVISTVYLKNLTKLFSVTEVKAVADLVPEKAQKQAREFGIEKACTVDELLADPEIRMVINLTIPKAHAAVSLAILEAGKNVYIEKPLAVTREEGQAILKKAGEKGLKVGCAPDTFMGAGIQTCIKLINDGWIGRPVAVTAFRASRGHETWHPDPAFYYQTGGGPLFDIGPYYLTALVALLGPVARVTASAGISYPQRVITSEPKRGQIINVEVPTHVAGVMDFKSGVIGTVIQSFDIWNSNLPKIEIYGSEGTLSVPDPNKFGGTILLSRAGQSEWKEMPYTHGYAENSRGLGAADMARAIACGRKHRAGGELAYHVLDIMNGFYEASGEGKHVTLASTCESPEMMPLGLADGELD